MALMMPSAMPSPRHERSGPSPVRFEREHREGVRRLARRAVRARSRARRAEALDRRIARKRAQGRGEVAAPSGSAGRATSRGSDAWCDRAPPVGRPRRPRASARVRGGWPRRSQRRCRARTDGARRASRRARSPARRYRPAAPRPSRHLLGRHVPHRAHTVPLPVARTVGLSADGTSRSLQRAREAEVEDLHAAVTRQEHVLGLDVAMDDAARVCGVEAIGDGGRNRDGRPPGLRALREPRAQCLALQQFGDREEDPPVQPDVVDGEDVRVRERRDRLRLALESRAGIVIVRQARLQHLEGDVALQARVACAIDLAHAALSEGTEHFVVDPGGCRERVEGRAHSRWDSTGVRRTSVRRRRGGVGVGGASGLTSPSQSALTRPNPGSERPGAPFGVTK